MAFKSQLIIFAVLVIAVLYSLPITATSIFAPAAASVHLQFGDEESCNRYIEYRLRDLGSVQDTILRSTMNETTYRSFEENQIRRYDCPNKGYLLWSGYPAYTTFQLNESAHAEFFSFMGYDEQDINGLRSLLEANQPEKIESVIVQMSQSGWEVRTSPFDLTCYTSSKHYCRDKLTVLYAAALIGILIGTVIFSIRSERFISNKAALTFAVVNFAVAGLLIILFLSLSAPTLVYILIFLYPHSLLAGAITAVRTTSRGYGRKSIVALILHIILYLFWIFIILAVLFSPGIIYY